MGALRVLAADIGGTNARFAACEVDAKFLVRRGPVFRMATRHRGAASFPEFWAAFAASAPPGLAEVARFDAVALALAGSVRRSAEGPYAVLPNIDWDITPADIEPLGPAFLLNDFAAQGYALCAPADPEGLEEIRGGGGVGAIAVVGAGTGLGHCALMPGSGGDTNPLPWTVAGSEAGHATFAFHGEEERAIEQRMMCLCGKRWLSNDDVVSGLGAAHLHEALTGRAASPAEALGDADSETARWFARFYARACRNYCLNVFPVTRLIVSGGLAVRNPHLVRSSSFLNEFEDGGDYDELLRRIAIQLNTDQDIGIRGAAIYAACQLRHPAG